VQIDCRRFLEFPGADGHSPALARKFREAGQLVDEADIQGEPWYLEDWIEHMMPM